MNTDTLAFILINLAAFITCRYWRKYEKPTRLVDSLMKVLQVELVVVTALVALMNIGII